MFRERKPIPLGLVVVTWLVLAVMVVLNINTIMGALGRGYSVELPEAAGLKQGDPVRISGLTVGRVDSVALGGKAVVATFSITNNDIHFGRETTASIGVETVLGDKALDLTSAGTGTLEVGARIPLSRSTAPYDVNDALSDLTYETGSIDVDHVAKALDTVSTTLDGAAPELQDALRGISRITLTISSRDQELRSLLSHADQFSKILADRSGDMTTLVSDGNVLFAELNRRREYIRSLLVNVSSMSHQLKGLVNDNQATLTPALRQINQVIKTLQSNKQNLQKTLKGLSVYATGLGEVVSSGQFFTAYLQNLAPGNLVNPTINLQELGLGGLLGKGFRW